MRERTLLRGLRRLAEVQRARRGAAEDALGQARGRKSQAEQAERAAAARTSAAQQGWEAHLATPGFAPEYGQALAARLIEADAAEQSSAALNRAAAEAVARREGEWQELEAQLRAGDRTSRRLTRHLRRREEEKAVAAQADLTTFGTRRL